MSFTFEWDEEKALYGSLPLERRLYVKEEIMGKEKNEEVEILDEYDFSNGVVGKYAKQYAEGTNMTRQVRDRRQHLRFILVKATNPSLSSCQAQ